MVFMFNVPVNNFSVILGRSHRFLGIYQYFFGTLKFLAQGHYMAVMGFEPWTTCSGVRSFTTEPPRLLQNAENRSVSNNVTQKTIHCIYIMLSYFPMLYLQMSKEA